VSNVKRIMAGRSAMLCGKEKESVSATEFGEGANEEDSWREESIK
jgi:hypothetical protein